MIKISLVDFLKLSKDDISGKVLCFTTDTVWGVGVVVDYNLSSGLNKIYQMKKRDLNKPLAVLTSNIEEIKKHVIYDQDIEDVMNKWPGALTIIFKKKDDFFNELTDFDTIALRIPNNHVSLSILDYLGFIATTSVNLSNSEPLNNKEDIEKYFSEYIDYLIVDETHLSKVSSTIVDVTNKPFKVIRSGDIKINV